MANYVKLKLLNEHFQCGICQGYIIDATTVSECLHSFCKSCIFHFIESIDNCCPTCNQSLGDIDHCLSFDSSLQRLIYQLIPNILANELDRRQKFQEIQEIESTTILNENSLVSLKLTNLPPKSTKLLELLKNKRQNPIESDENSDSETYGNVANKNSESNSVYPEPTTVKYIQCIAQTPIRIICRMLQNKYNVPEDYRVRIYCMGHKLGETETLLEIFTSFIKSKCDVLELEYKYVRLNTARKSRDLHKESSQLVDSLSRSLDIQETTKKRQSSPTKKKESHDTTISTKSPTVNKPRNKKPTPIKSRKDEKEPKTSKTNDESLFKSSAKEQQPAQDLNETVYYSDEENSSEGKLLIADDSNSSDSAKPPTQSSLRNNYSSRKKTSSMCD